MASRPWTWPWPRLVSEAGGVSLLFFNDKKQFAFVELDGCHFPDGLLCVS